MSKQIRAGTGGQTRAVIGRNRLFTQLTGQPTNLITIDDDPRYRTVRETFTASGELIEGMQLLNLFEWYRDRDLPPDTKPIADALPELQGFTTVDIPHPDGGVHYTSYREQHSGDEALRDYRRADGSVYIRTPAGWGYSATPYLLVDRDGRPVASWRRMGGWAREWLQTLTEGSERVFMITDSRYAFNVVHPIRDERFHVIYQVHNAHVRGVGLWNSWVVPDYEPLLRTIPELDGMVLLTERQREDVAERYGPTNNLFTVPNTVDLPELPDPMPPREHATFAIVTRLEPQKNLLDAIEVWALVLKRRPEARPLIYGEGRVRDALQRRIDELEIGDGVTLMGYDRGARRQLLTATGFLMTSTYEGHPLATLESLSFGCPVLSFDIKYGPRDQIADGVDGILVPAGDVAAMAEQVVRLIDDPALVARLSKEALRAADRFDHQAYVQAWGETLDTVVANKPGRVRLEPTLKVHELSHIGSGRVPERLRRTSRSSWAGSDSRRMHLSATLRVKGKIPAGALEDASLSLSAISAATGAVVPLPLTIIRTRRRFDLTSDFDVAETFAAASGSDSALRLRLRLVLNNVAWDAEPARPADVANYEISYAADGTVELHRG